MHNPIITLVEKRQRAQYGRYFVESSTVVALVLLLELGGFEVFTPTGLAIAAALLGVLIPVLAGVPMARFLAALRRERLLEYIRISALAESDVVDGLAQAAIRAVLPTGAAIAVFLVVAGDVAHLRAGAEIALVLWLPLMLAATVGAAYVAQWADYRSLQDAGIYLVVAVLAALFLPSVVGWPVAALLALLSAALGARRASLMMSLMDMGPRGRNVRAAVHGRRSHNPILVREMARAFSRQGGNWVRFWLHNGIGLPVALVGLAMSLYAWQGPSMACGGLIVMLFVIQPLRAAWRTGTALVLEKDQGTLELMFQSPMTSQQFVDGWVMAGLLPTLLETGLALPVALLFNQSWTASISVTLDLGILIVMSAYLGIMMSSVAPNRTIAHRFLHFWTALYVGFGVVPVALAAFTASGADVAANLVYPPLMGLACVALFRQWTMARVQDDPVLTGFSPPS